MPDKPLGLSVAALIDDGQGRILLLRRSKESNFFAGQWEPPGGKIDQCESFDFALLREVKEETGLIVALDGVAGATEFELPHIRVALLYMKAHVVSGEVRLSEEHEEYAWVPLSEFPAKDLSPKLKNFMEGVGAQNSG